MLAAGCGAAAGHASSTLWSSGCRADHAFFINSEKGTGLTVRRNRAGIFKPPHCFAISWLLYINSSLAELELFIV